MIKFEYNIDDEGNLNLRKWTDTEQYPSAFYTNQDIDNLFKSFISPSMRYKYKNKDTNFKWDYLEKISEHNYFNRTIIDSTQINLINFLIMTKIMGVLITICLNQIVKHL